MRIHVSAVNPTDWKSRQGSTAGTRLDEPQVPNQDGAGVIDAVGPGVTDHEPGDRVWLWDAAYQRTDGTAQELVVIPDHQVVPLPDEASFELGASLGIPALTAHRALTASESGPDLLYPGALDSHTVLVTGGAGAVGHFAIQLAVWAGATVITTVSSPEKAELARRAGAHHVLDYRRDDVDARLAELAPEGIDTVVEVNATANIDTDVRALAQGGTIAIYTSDEHSHLAVPVRASMVKNARIQFVLTYTTTPEQKHNAVEAVSAAVEDGALSVGDGSGLPIIRYPLENTADAHRAVEQNAVGKVIIELG